MANEKGEWKTINGRHVFIKDGQSLEEAMKEKGMEFKAKEEKRKKEDFDKTTDDDFELEEKGKDAKKEFDATNEDDYGFDEDEGINYDAYYEKVASGEEYDSPEHLARDLMHREGLDKDTAMHEARGIWDDVMRNEFDNPNWEDEVKEVDGKKDFDSFNEEEFVKTIDTINWDKAEENEKQNANKGKSESRKDKYGNPLVSDEAFKIGQKGAKAYLDDMTKYYDLEKLKKSNVFLGGVQNAINKAIAEAGFNPDLDTTYQDLNEIAGSVLGEEVSFEDYERNATKGFTGKKYSGYDPDKKEENNDFENKKNGNANKPTEGLLNHNDSYKYALLDRLRADAEYYLNAKSDKYLWSGNPEQHITDMKALYNSLKEKPEWLTEEKINEYEKKFKEIKNK